MAPKGEEELHCFPARIGQQLKCKSGPGLSHLSLSLVADLYSTDANSQVQWRLVPCSLHIWRRAAEAALPAIHLEWLCAFGAGV